MGAAGIFGGGIPLQPSTKTEKLQLHAKTMPKFVHFCYFLFLINNKFSTH